MLVAAVKISSIICGILFVSIYIYFWLLHLKRWLFDEFKPNLARTPLGKLVCRFGKPGGVWEDTFLFCIIVWAASIVVCLLAFTPICKWALLGAFIGATLVGAAHGLRWLIRTKRYLDECNKTEAKSSDEDFKLKP